MHLSPHFILPTPCTFMTPRPSRYGQPLPGVRELFPDLFPTPQVPPPPMTYDLRRRTTHDWTNTSSASTPRHSPPYWATARGTAIGTTDHQYPPVHSNPTQQQPTNYDIAPSTSIPYMPPRSASPEDSSPCSQPRQQVECGTGPSSLPDNEPASSPMTSSPHMASCSTEFASQPTSFDRNSVETKKRHKCDVCGSYWGRPSSLKIHMVSHTGVKEFVCSICKQDFGVKSNYTRHIRVHHKDSGEGIQTRAPGRRRHGPRRHQDIGPVRFVDEGPKFQGQ
jgi:hypothetical protein